MSAIAITAMTSMVAAKNTASAAPTSAATSETTAPASRARLRSGEGRRTDTREVRETSEAMDAPLCPLASGNAEFFRFTARPVNHFGVNSVAKGSMKNTRAHRALHDHCSQALNRPGKRQEPRAASPLYERSAHAMTYTT